MNKNTLKILFVLVGAMVGAGFASGKEVFLFFSRYGVIGVFTGLFSCALTGFIIYKTLCFIKYYDLDNYNDFITVITNRNKSFINNVFSIIVNIFLYFSFIIMISGFGAFFYQIYEISNLITISITCFICFCLFNSSKNRIAKVNTLLIPFLIFIIIFYSSKKAYIDLNLLNYSSTNIISALFSGVLYSSYNSILLIPVIISLYKLIKKSNMKEIRTVSISSFLIFFILCVAVINLLFSLEPDSINSVDLPMLLAIESMGAFQYFVYGIIIVIAIFTSAISAGYGLVINFKDSKYYPYISAILCFSAIIFCNIDFSSLVSRLYPVFGFLGIIQILFILLKKVPKTDIN